MATRPAPEFSRDRFYAGEHTATNETSWDWRDHNAVTYVKNQGAVGCCYAMAAVAAMEGQMAIQNDIHDSYSVEHIIDCDTMDCGMFGGWPHQVYEFTEKNGGLPKWDDQPCCTFLGNASCFPCMADHNKTQCGPGPSYCNQTWTDDQCNTKNWKPAVQIKSWQAISQNEDQIAAALQKIGPLAIGVDATAQFQMYKKGILDPRKSLLFKCHSGKDEINHAVTLVGYGTENGKDYWLIKNSWGKKWGENGYFRLIRGIGACGMNEVVTVPIL